MSRKTKIPKCLQEELKNGDQETSEDLLQSSGNLDVSSIEKASFLQGEQYSSHGNPLHSTAVEEDYSPEPNSHQRSNTGNKKVDHIGTVTPKTSVITNNRLTKTKRKSGVQEQSSSDSEESQIPSQRKPQASKYQTRHLQTISESKEDKGRKSTESEVSAPAVSKDSITDGSAGAGSHDHGWRRPSLSSEDLTDEDETFHPNNEKRKASIVTLQKSRRSSSGRQQRGQKQKRKSSSGSSDSGKLSKKLKRGGVRNLIDLDVILEAFQQFAADYKETINSGPVKQAINAVSCSFEEQLDEMITAVKEYGSVKRQAVKINSTLNRKKSRLLEVKNELIKTEAELVKLKKEHGQLEMRLKGLTQGTTFIANLTELNKRYLQHRTAHPEEPETYGPSCMTAMLLEARSIMGTENQLKMINDKMQQFLEETGHK